MDREKIKVLWGITMTIFYLGLAGVVAFSNIFDHLGKGFRTTMLIIFLLYGIFRGYRTWKDL